MKTEKMEKNIRIRSDGRYEARYVKSRDESGRAVYASCYGKTYEEAIEKRDRAMDIKFISDYRPRGLNLLILGAGSHGQEVYEIANELHMFTRIEFLDDDTDKMNAIGSWEDITELRKDFTAAIVAVGDEHTRKLWFSKLSEAGYVIPTLVHPSAVISATSTLGVGSVICARAVVSPGAQIGNGCIIAAGVAIGRDRNIEDWTHIDVGGVVRWNNQNEIAK